MANRPTKTVVIVGKPGVGKSTIGNQILGCDRFRAGPDSVYECSCETNGNLKVLLVNTFPRLQQDLDRPRSRSGEVCKLNLFTVLLARSGGERNPDPEGYYRTHIPQRGSQVLFVFRQDRFTEDTQTQLEAAIGVLNENVSEVSALVITHCEGMTQTAKENVIKDFNTNPRTEKIAKFMGRGIYCVGFPDTKKIEPQLQELYTEGIANSQEILKRLVPRNSTGKEDVHKEIELLSPLPSGYGCNIL